jgi:pimeloyl-ACP methyl ester carboxylesterase
MKKSFVRRSVAAVASLGMVVVGIPLATTPAQAQVEACALGATCQGEVPLPAPIGTGSYTIKMPEKFNGTVMMFSHGYRLPLPLPAILAIPGRYNENPNYQAISNPAFTPIFGSPVAYAALNTPEVAPSPTVEAQLLAQGYALAGIGYPRQGWAVAEGVAVGESVMQSVNAGLVPGTKRIVTWGNSMGANIAMTIAERNPKRVAGVIGNCGAYAGPEALLGNAMTLLFSWKTLLAPNLKLVNYTPGQAGVSEALGDIGTIARLAAGVGQGQTTSQATGLPVAQANMLGALLGGFPAQNRVYDGLTINPIVDVLAANPEIGAGRAPGVAGAQGYNPVTAGQSSALAMLQNSVAQAALGVFARYDLEMRARQALQLPPTANANFTDNVPVRYSALLSSEQRGEFDGTINSGLPNATNIMLGRLDESIGNPAVRFAANPDVVNWIRSLPGPKGVYNQATVLMTTTFDDVTPAGNQRMITNQLERSWKKKGKKAGLNKIVSLYTIPPADGYTKFDPGARGPSDAASRAASNSGVGHCQFDALDNGIQIVNSVSVLNRLMNAKTQKQVAAARRLGYNTPGVNSDRLYTPDPLKNPLATAAR